MTLVRLPLSGLDQHSQYLTMALYKTYRFSGCKEGNRILGAHILENSNSTCRNGSHSDACPHTYSQVGNGAPNTKARNNVKSLSRGPDKQWVAHLPTDYSATCRDNLQQRQTCMKKTRNRTVGAVGSKTGCTDGHSCPRMQNISGGKHQDCLTVII